MTLKTLIIDDLVPKQVIKGMPDTSEIKYSDYKPISAEVVKCTENEIHISTLWSKKGGG